MESRVGRRFQVRTPYGELTHEIRLSCDEGPWQARIVTLPRQIWVAPGGGRALTFEAPTPEEAETMAAEFIERECIARGHRSPNPMRRDRDLAAAGPARRLIGQFPTRFAACGALSGQGDVRSHTGTTTNVSETGLFIATEDALYPGSRITLELKLPGSPERLEGVVVGARTSGGQGRNAGMGVRLTSPPLSYRARIQSLGPAAGAAAAAGS